MSKEHCEHIKRQAIAGGLDSFVSAPFGIVCLDCGELLVQGNIKKDNKFNKLKKEL